MFVVLQGILGDEQGVTVIEYAFIASLIAVVIAAAVSTVGSAVSSSFSNVANSF